MKVRIGIHTDDAVIENDGDIIGAPVDKLARICGKAACGGIAISAETKALLASSAGKSVTFRPSLCWMKGLVFQFVYQMLDQLDLGRGFKRLLWLQNTVMLLAAFYLVSQMMPPTAQNLSMSHHK